MTKEHRNKMTIKEKAALMEKMSDNAYRCAQAFKDTNAEMYRSLMSESLAYRECAWILTRPNYCKDTLEVFNRMKAK